MSAWTLIRTALQDGKRRYRLRDINGSREVSENRMKWSKKEGPGGLAPGPIFILLSHRIRIEAIKIYRLASILICDADNLSSGFLC